MYRRWLDPIEELQRMQEWMERVVGEVEPIVPGRLLPARTGGEIAGVASPSLDIQDTEDKILVTADVPGVEKGDITLNVRGDMLEITAEKTKEKEEKGEGYIRRERGYTKFYRRIPLPAEVDPNNVDAALKDGVLRIEMVKTARLEVKQIEVK
ncbi:MAG: Hsp20/alpha crystallin family protein [Methanosarcinales archaeon]|nr:Hsp20/alpha crystallin family protein [Methanosarcinales archaeon]MCK4652272.1 Hsp20/alpha crystallin family protein [Methanosarcinales archaeon]